MTSLLDKNAQFPWTEPNTIVLFQTVQVVGAHIAQTKEDSGAKWNEVNDTYFNLASIKQLKSKHYKKDEYRKIKEKFGRTMKSVKKDIETGNQSGKSGDLSPLYKLVHQIEIEIEDAATKLQQQKDAKKKKSADKKARKALLKQNLSGNIIFYKIRIIIYYYIL